MKSASVAGMSATPQRPRKSSPASSSSPRWPNTTWLGIGSACDGRRVRPQHAAQRTLDPYRAHRGWRGHADAASLDAGPLDQAKLRFDARHELRAASALDAEQLCRPRWKLWRPALVDEQHD